MPFKRDLPNLIIVGIAKCGTSSIHDYLNLHPDISMSKIKEPGFFNNSKITRISEYKKLWPNKNKIMGESSASYTEAKDFEKIPLRLKKHLGDIKIIFATRDPIERMLSHYVNFVRKKCESRNLSSALFDKSGYNPYVELSKYYNKIVPYWEIFGSENIHVIDLEDLKINPMQEMNRIYKFLKLEKFYSRSFLIPLNKSNKKKSDNAFTYSLKKIKNYIIPFDHPTPDIIYNLYKRVLKTNVKKPKLTKQERLDLKSIICDDILKFIDLTSKNYSWSDSYNNIAK